MAVRRLVGNKHDLPGGLEPMEWASRVFRYMDEGDDEETAREKVRRDVEGDPDDGDDRARA